MKVIWALCFLFLLQSLNSLMPQLKAAVEIFGIKLQGQSLREIASQLGHIEDTLLIGLVPTSEKWETFNQFPCPWNSLITESIRELRASGAALLPTLQRLRKLADDQ